MYLFLIAAVLIFQNGEAYKAAVYEHYPKTLETPITTIKANLKEYRLQVENAADKATDIIVFPEYGLTTLVEDPTEYAINIRSDDTGILKEISAIAFEHKMYLVVNLLEKEQDGSNKTLYYNTNLVFDREGNITAKYRKINLYDEPKLTAGTETVTFNTNFGVTFGLFTCFDILFYNPSVTVFDSDKVTDIVFPTAWYNTLPFWSSLSAQHGYAKAHGVNLLASNYGKPKNALGGSGIYLASGEIRKTYIDSSPSSKLIIQEVPEIKRRTEPNNCEFINPQGLPIPDKTSNISEFVTIKDFKASDYSFQDVDLSQRSVSSRICQNDWCCDFNITIRDGNNNEHYKLVAFNGVVTSDKHKNKEHLRICSLVACETDSKDTCGARLNGNTRFLIHVKADLTADNMTFYRPVTVDYTLRPVDQINYCNDGNNVQLRTRYAHQGIVAFGIFGQVNSAVQNTGILALLIVAAKLILF